MAEPVSSFFLDNGLLGMVSPQQAEQAASAANKAFMFGLLSGDIGAAYMNAQKAGYGTIQQTMEYQKQQAAAAEAARKRGIEIGQQKAVQDASEQDPNTGIGTSDPAYAPRNERGEIVAGPGYIPPRYQINPERLLSDPRYLAGVGNEPAALKALDELRQAAAQRSALQTLSNKYRREDGTVDTVRLAQDPMYIQLLGNDPSKLKTVGDVAYEGGRRVTMRDLDKSTPFAGAPGTPSAATQAEATKAAYRARIDAYNNAGFFEEAAKLTNQLEKLFPEEGFGQDIKYVKNTKTGKTEAVVVGNKGTVRPVPGYTQPVSADTIYNANKPQIQEADGGIVRINPMTGKVSPVMAGGKPLMGKGEIRESSDGLVRVQGGVATPITTAGGQPVMGKQSFTEDEQKSAGFYSRMLEAEKGMQTVVGKGKTLEKAAGKPEFLGEAARTVLPDFLGAQAIGNFADSKQRQQYRQFQENWVRANLRAESGAAIGKEEMEKEVRTYFPQVGDSPEVIAQKAEARRVTAEAMRKRAGKAVSSPAALPPGGAAPTPALGGARSTLGDIYNNYGLTPPR